MQLSSVSRLMPYLSALFTHSTLAKVAFSGSGVAKPPLLLPLTVLARRLPEHKSLHSRRW
jgi:hypothetical protein